MKLPFTLMVTAALALPPATSAQDSKKAAFPDAADSTVSALPVPSGLELPSAGFL